MVKKSIRLLKENPIVILFYIGFLFIIFLIMFSLYPRDLNRFMNVADFNLEAYIVAMMKLMAASLLMGILEIVFFSGYWNMIAEAVTKGKTCAGSFLPGLKKFFVRVLLGVLLTLAFSVVLSVVISLITVPFIIITVLREAGSANIYTGAYETMGIGITLIAMGLAVIVIPFVMLWFPAIFTDDIGVIRGLAQGCKAGVKNYWKLFLTLVIIYLPVGIYLFVDKSAILSGQLFTPGMFTVCLIDAVIVIFVMPMLFIMYGDYRQNQGSFQ